MDVGAGDDGAQAADQQESLRDRLWRTLGEAFVARVTDQLPEIMVSHLAIAIKDRDVSQQSVVSALRADVAPEEEEADVNELPETLAGRLGLVDFAAFRGLGNYTWSIDGRKIVLLADNGSGKTALVDGLEFFFSGDLSAFRGAGTAGIQVAQVLKHILANADPAVSVRLHNGNGVAVRTTERLQCPADDTALASYISQHPDASSFILRRKQLLAFIDARDAGRYQSLVHLLGLGDLDAAQEAFVDAEARAEQHVARCGLDMQAYLRPLTPPHAESAPANSAELLTQLGEMLERIEGPSLEEWDQLDGAIELLDRQRHPEVRAKLDQLNGGITSLASPVRLRADLSVRELNDLALKCQDLIGNAIDGPRRQVLRAGGEYFERNPDARECPLCLKVLDEEPVDFLASVNARLEALKALTQTEQMWKTGTEALCEDMRVVARRIRDDWRALRLLGEDIQVRGALLRLRLDAREWLRAPQLASLDTGPRALPEAPQLADVEGLRAQAVAALREEHAKITVQDVVDLERAYQVLVMVRDRRPALERAERARALAVSELRRLQIARREFSASREVALDQVLNTIETKVMEYYGRLHAEPDQDAADDCTGMRLSLTGRAAQGGLALRIRFWDRVESNPRAYLSEGHLDSFGLCIYLATVRLFNPAGSLLVLDDVVTSIDRAHRARIRDLLITEFEDFQIIITTHDVYWFESIKEGITALTRGGQWRFERIARWTLEHGPESGSYETTWEYINSCVAANANADAWQFLGGALRVVFEDFLKRVAEKLEIKIRYQCDGLYTAGSFVFGGVHTKLRAALVRAEPDAEAAIDQEVMRVFNTRMVNALSHDRPDRLEVAREEVVDFVHSLQALRDRAVAARAIRGPIG